MNKNITQSRFLPYEADYALLSKWRFAGNILLFVVGVLSIATAIVSNNYMQYANIIAIFSYYVINVVTEIFLYPATARSRRISFIDNSLGAKFLSQATKNYFTNDALKPGLYKLGVNCFENCYFTYNIAKEMNPSVITKNVIFGFVFFTIAYIGNIQGNILFLPILQILLSTLFFTELIHHITFVSRLKILLERFEIFFNDTIKSKSKRNNSPHPILLLLEYETTLAFNKAPLSDKIYQKLNAKLSTEWDEMKKYYEII